MTHTYTGVTYDKIVVRQPFTIESDHELTEDQIVALARDPGAWINGAQIDWDAYEQADEDHEVIEVAMDTATNTRSLWTA